MQGFNRDLPFRLGSLSLATVLAVAAHSAIAGEVVASGNTLAPAASPAVARTKDIVLDQVSAPVLLAAPAAAPVASPAAGVAVPPVVAPAEVSDALVVSVLEESLDGDLTPRSAGVTLKSNARFRIKLLSSRDGTVTLRTINPEGKRAEKPLLTLEVKAGQESVTQRLALAGAQGQEYMEITLQPKTASEQFIGWLTSFWQSKDKAAVSKAQAVASKDIVLDSYSTPQATYTRNPKGEGVMTYVRIQHVAK